MADLAALFDLGWALRDVALSLEPAAPLASARVTLAVAAALTEVAMQIAAVPFVAPDVGVDRLMLISRMPKRRRMPLTCSGLKSSRSSVSTSLQSSLLN